MVGATAAPRRAWSVWIRLGLSAVILAVLLYKAHPSEVISDLRDGTMSYFLAGVAVSAVGLILSAWRWQRVLIAIGEPFPLRRLISLYLAGQFVSNLLPSSIGGDVLRVARVGADTGSRTTAFASVVLERMTGWVVLPVLALTGMMLSGEFRTLGQPAHFGATIAVGTLVLLAVVIYLAGHPRAAGRFAERDSWSRFIGAVHLGVDRMRRDPANALGVLAASFIYQATTVLAFALAIRVVGFHLPLTTVLAFAPIVAIVQVFGFMGGLGAREVTLYVFLRGLVHAQAKDAAAVGLLFFAMIGIVSIGGIPSFVRNRPHVRVEV